MIATGLGKMINSRGKIILRAHFCLRYTITADTLLEKAIFKDSFEEIQQAVQAGANIDNANEKPPILLAVLLKKPCAIDTLINLGANLEISYEGYELVHYALKLEDFESALLLVKARAPLGKPKDMHQKGVIYPCNRRSRQ